MKRIVIVDDDAGIQEAVACIFDPQQYEVIILANGNAILNDQSPVADIYILDKQLSGVDGLDICRYLKGRASTQQIPVILMSANPHINRLARSAGADAVIEKPFSLRTLRNMVDRYLEQ